MADSNYIFVYGTLLDESVNHMAHFLKLQCEPVGIAYIKAKLYKITWYPAIVLSDNNADKVIGKVFKIPEHNKEMVLQELDDYEGIYESNDQSDEYERVITTAIMEDNKTLNCWVYNYKASVEKAEHIRSGDFLTYLKK